MNRHLLAPLAALAIVAQATVALPDSSIAQAPRMGGGFKNAIAIPVDDSQTPAIAGALFKPEDAGPFPAVIYMGTCSDINSDEERFMHTAARERLVAKGFALMIVDPYWPRRESRGVCDKPNAGAEYDVRSAGDIHAAASVLAAMPDIDSKRIFVEGVGLGASAALLAIDAGRPAAHKTKLAGAVAVSPACKQDAALSAPALILIGDQDHWALAAKCQALAKTPNIEVKVYRGVGHAFAMPFGHRVQHNLEAARDAESRADRFLAAHAGP